MLRAGLVASALAALTHARPASANVLDRFMLRGEVTAGSMLPLYQRDLLGFFGHVHVALRPGVVIVRPLTFQLGAGTAYFPSVAGGGQYAAFTAGLRIEPVIARTAALFFDANLGVGLTGFALPAPLARFTYDVGLGAEFMVGKVFALGPVLRFHHIVSSQNAGDAPSDAFFWSLGISARLRGVETQATVIVVHGEQGDGDGDGVPDDKDACVNIHTGAHADPDRAGCPMFDSDNDGVFDKQDECPTAPSGALIDPLRPGCPALDGDHDGVMDLADECPAEPLGAVPDPSRKGCPDPDDDRDGVFNSRDTCPTRSRGFYPDPAHAGCPLPDGDSDNVPDSADKCPAVFGSPTSDPATNGCPGLVVLDARTLRILRPIFFATRSARILLRSAPVLAAVANALRYNTAITRLSIEGHTDEVGNPQDNQTLSEQRALAVMQALIELGIDPHRLESRGLGETQPITLDRSSRARQINRRVEFQIMDVNADAAQSPSQGATAP